MPTNQNPPSQSTYLAYPEHTESFEFYYHLGEMRTLKATALYRFQADFPQYTPDNPLYPSKFESYYTKIKRWAKREMWNEWVSRKELEDRHRREGDMREKLGTVTKTIRGYQGLVRQSILVFSEKVKASNNLRAARMSGDVDAVARYEAQDRIEIKNFREAKDMMELDMYLSKLLNEQPPMASEEEGRLGEAQGEKIDAVMELIKRKAMEGVGARGGEDAEEDEEAENENPSGETIPSDEGR